MRALLNRSLFALPFSSSTQAFSSVSLRLSREEQAAFLTLTNEKKRNPLSLETIRELHAALKEVASKIH
jgi:hypothetical protein